MIKNILCNIEIMITPWKYQYLIHARNSTTPRFHWRFLKIDGKIDLKGTPSSGQVCRPWIHGVVVITVRTLFLSPPSNLLLPLELLPDHEFMAWL
jgi:hypothetical protein